MLSLGAKPRVVCSSRSQVVVNAAKRRPQSRIGKKPVQVPKEVSVTLSDNHLKVKVRHILRQIGTTFARHGSTFLLLHVPWVYIWILLMLSLSLVATAKPSLRSRTGANIQRSKPSASSNAFIVLYLYCSLTKRCCRRLWQCRVPRASLHGSFILL